MRIARVVVQLSTMCTWAQTGNYCVSFSRSQFCLGMEVGQTKSIKSLIPGRGSNHLDAVLKAPCQRCSVCFLLSEIREGLKDNLSPIQNVVLIKKIKTKNNFKSIIAVPILIIIYSLYRIFQTRTKYYFVLYCNSCYY